MENQDAKNFLLNLEREVSTPPNGMTPASVVNAAHGVLVRALKASLAREDALLRAPKTPTLAEMVTRPVEKELPRSTIPTTGKKRDGQSTV